MSLWGEWVRRAGRLGRRRRFDEELADEVRFHLEARAEDLEREGLTREEAQWQARREFGRVASSAEETRAAWGWPVIEGIVQDLRYGLRQLRLSPGFATVAILSLALGVGANTAIFQLLDAVRLRSLPVRDPGELVAIEIPGGNHGFGLNSGWNSLTYPVFEQIRDHQEAFAGVFGVSPGEPEVGEGNARHRIRGLWLSGGAFATLGVPAERGRVFEDADDRPGCADVAVVSHGFWERELGASDAAVGSTLTLNGKPTRVIGVTPPEFFGVDVGSGFDVAMPFCSFTGWDLEQRNVFWLGVMGRLKPDWTAERSSRYLQTASVAWFQEAAPTGYDAASMAVWNRFRLTATPSANGVSGLREQYETSLWLLLGITGLVLLIACANLANLMLARAAARQREIAVRMAIGASRSRVIAQMFWESLLIAVAGAAAGAGLAVILSQTLVRFLSPQANDIELDLSADWRVVTFVAAVALAACVCFGLSTALYATRRRALASANAGSRGATAARGRFSFQRVLIAAQVAISLVLVVSSLLFVRSFRHLFTVDAGLQQRGVVFHSVDFRPLKPPPERAKALQQEVLDRLRAAPGIEAASTSTQMPLIGSGWSLSVRVPGEDQERSSRFTWVSPQYFATMRIPILAGRDFTDADTKTAPRVLLVNQEFVRQFFDGASPVGKQVRSLAEPGYPETIYEIVGLVRDTKYLDLRDRKPEPIAYAPDQQHPQPGAAGIFLTRSALPVADAERAVREAIAQVNPGIRVNAQVEVRERAVARLSRERLLAWLAGFFGVLASVLAAIGLYGVVSYMVAGRRNEIGIRLALGASRGGVVRMILRQVGRLLGVGLAVGAVLALGLAGAARTLLFGLEPDDPVTLAAAAAVLGGIAVWASWVPARRAARMDPQAALREE